jgi:hypothetical protein
VGHGLFTLARQPGHRKYPHVEECAEERSEKHHFGKNEPAHGHYEGPLDLGVGHAALVFLNHGAEPGVQHASQQRQPGHQHQGRQPLYGEPRADRHGPQGRGRQHRHPAVFGNVVIALGCHLVSP